MANLEVHRCVLRLQDYLFFATTERGKVYETGAFLHNYALAYALRLVNGPYYNRIQKPLYQEHLEHLNEQGVYITPAQICGTPRYCLHQFNTIKEGYGFGKKDRSIGYPDWGYFRLLAPETEFVFYIILKKLKTQSNQKDETLERFLAYLAQGQFYIRLGKLMSKASVTVLKAANVQTGKEGGFVANALLNWRDLHEEPIMFDLIGNSLPTRLIANVTFNKGRSIVAYFPEEQQVMLPGDMSFLHKRP